MRQTHKCLIGISIFILGGLIMVAIFKFIHKRKTFFIE